MIDLTLVQEWLYRGSYIVLFAIIIALWNGFKQGKIVRIFFLMVFGGLFIWSRFIEPQQILVKHTTIDLGADTTVALLADMHLGVYKDWHYLQRVVNEVNKQSPDMVVIAGDFINHPLSTQTFNELFAPLADLSMPVYAVLGNHDIAVSGNNDRLGLIKALEFHGVRFLHNDIVRANSVFLVGLGSHLGAEDDVEILDQLSQEDTVVALLHNPDTVGLYTNNSVDLSLAGHTHCGQIRIPIPAVHELLRPRYYPVKGDFDCGLSQEKHTTLYITAGLGEVILPMRFQAAPSIDILHL